MWEASISKDSFSCNLLKKGLDIRVARVFLFCVLLLDSGVEFQDEKARPENDLLLYNLTLKQLQLTSFLTRSILFPVPNQNEKLLHFTVFTGGRC